MRVLKICLTYSCPFKCYFCFNKDKAEDTTLLNLETLDAFLNKNSSLFDKIVITGGESTLIFKSYLRNAVDIIKKYTSLIEMETYPMVDYTFFNEFPEISPIVSYDITARPRAQEVWKQLLKIQKPFNIVVTLSPLMFRFHPNKVLQTLNMLPNLQHIEFKPFFDNKNFQHPIKKSDYAKFMNGIYSSKLNLHYTYSYASLHDEFILNPYGKLFSVQFENDNRVEKEIQAEDIVYCETNYPDKVRL